MTSSDGGGVSSCSLNSPAVTEYRSAPSHPPCAQVEEELWEEEFIERCVLELLEEEEQWEWFIPSRDLPPLQDQIGLRVLDADTDFDVVVSQ